MAAQFILGRLGLRSRCIEGALPLVDTIQLYFSTVTWGSGGGDPKMDQVQAFARLSFQMFSNSGPGRSRYEGAPGSALNWPWGIVESCGASGSEALEVGVSADTLGD